MVVDMGLLERVNQDRGGEFEGAIRFVFSVDGCRFTAGLGTRVFPRLAD
jgi:hypothetical protein